MSAALQTIARPVSEIIAKAKAEGRYKGRKPTARAKSAEVLRLHGEGRTPTEIAGAVGVGRGPVDRIVQNS